MSADAVRLLLSVVGHAPDLRTINRLRSMAVRSVDPALGRVIVEHKEVVMHAAVLNKGGRVLLGEGEEFWAAASTASALRVDDLHSEGSSLLRNVS